MIQDIAPHVYDVAYYPLSPKETDILLCYRKDTILCDCSNDSLVLPRFADFAGLFPQIGKEPCYLFSIDTTSFFLLRDDFVPASGSFLYCPVSILRTILPRHLAFAGITGWQLHQWYHSHRFCGSCGTPMVPDEKERAMRCPSCGAIFYPVICPSVIVAVTCGSRILLTRYAPSHSTYRNLALIAGYTEIGETLEQTVHREVREEVGLSVKNLRYYKSQPWSFSGTLLAGFFCEVDGDPTIRMDKEELSAAKWYTRKEMPPASSTASLTAEMMEVFRTGKSL